MPRLNELIEGFNRFHKHYYKNHPELFQKLTEQGQQPNIMLITCSDSRIAVDILTDTIPGQIFLMRNVANIVPPYSDTLHCEATTAGLEFAVCDLKIKDLIVLGHSQCGGIKALMGGETVVSRDSHLAQWVRLFEEARQETLDEHPHASFSELCMHCEKISLKHSLTHLATYPWIKSAVENGELKLHAWYFELIEGKLFGLNPETDEFHLLAPNEN